MQEPTRLDFGPNPTPFFSPSQIEVIKIVRTGEDSIVTTSSEAQFVPACIEHLVEHGGKAIALAPTTLNSAHICSYSNQISSSLTKPIKIAHIHAAGDQAREKWDESDLIIGTPTTIQWCVDQEMDISNLNMLIIESVDATMANKQYDSAIFEIYATISRLEKTPQIVAFSKSYPKQHLNALKRYMTEPKEVNLLAKRAKDYKVFAHLIDNQQPIEQQTTERISTLMQILTLPFRQCLIFSSNKTLSEAALKRIIQEGLNVDTFASPAHFKGEPILLVPDVLANRMNKEIYENVDLAISIDGQRFSSNQNDLLHLFGDFEGKEGPEPIVSICFVDVTELSSFNSLCQEQLISWEKLPSDLTCIGMKPQLIDWLEQDGDQPWTVTPANMKETMAIVREAFEDFSERPKKTAKKDVVEVLPTQDILTTLKEAGWPTPGPLSALMETEQWSQPRNTDVRNRITRMSSLWNEADARSVAGFCLSSHKKQIKTTHNY